MSILHGWQPQLLIQPQTISVSFYLQQLQISTSTEFYKMRYDLFIVKTSQQHQGQSLHQNIFAKTFLCKFCYFIQISPSKLIIQKSLLTYIHVSYFSLKTTHHRKTYFSSLKQREHRVSLKMWHYGSVIFSKQLGAHVNCGFLSASAPQCHPSSITLWRQTKQYNVVSKQGQCTIKRLHVISGSLLISVIEQRMNSSFIRTTL